MKQKKTSHWRRCPHRADSGRSGPQYVRFLCQCNAILQSIQLPLNIGSRVSARSVRVMRSGCAQPYFDPRHKLFATADGCVCVARTPRIRRPARSSRTGKSGARCPRCADTSVRRHNRPHKARDQAARADPDVSGADVMRPLRQVLWQQLRARILFATCFGT